MNAKRIFRMSFATVLSILVVGCAMPFSKNLRDMADPALTFEQVKQNPDAYESKVVVWGGEIVRTTNVREGTRIEIVQKPLDFELMPKFGDETGGRFMAIYDGYLDSAVYKKGRDITVAGKIVGQITEPLDEIEYAYPLVSAEEIHLWPEKRISPYSYPYPYYYRYWWYGPYWYYY